MNNMVQGGVEGHAKRCRMSAGGRLNEGTDHRKMPMLYYRPVQAGVKPGPCTYRAVDLKNK